VYEVNYNLYGVDELFDHGKVSRFYIYAVTFVLVVFMLNVFVAILLVAFDEIEVIMGLHLERHGMSVAYQLRRYQMIWTLDGSVCIRALIELHRAAQLETEGHRLHGACPRSCLGFRMGDVLEKYWLRFGSHACHWVSTPASV
jgi:hypothetical protein